jgi:S1-C subfamily serine protease
MRRNVVFWTVVLLTAYALHTFGADWSLVVKPLNRQVPRIEIQKDDAESPGVCSGVVLNTDPAWLLTAAHCIPPGDPKAYSLTANGRHAETVKINRILDLAVLKFSRKREDAIALAEDSPSIGTEICVAGYGFGIEKLAIQFGRVSQSKNDETKTLWLNVDTLFGDSGGAIVDEQGRLVGMTSKIYSKGPAHISGAIPIETIRDFVENYLPRKP